MGHVQLIRYSHVLAAGDLPLQASVLRTIKWQYVLVPEPHVVKCMFADSVGQGKPSYL